MILPPDRVGIVGIGDEAVDTPVVGPVAFLVRRPGRRYSLIEAPEGLPPSSERKTPTAEIPTQIRSPSVRM